MASSESGDGQRRSFPAGLSFSPPAEEAGTSGRFTGRLSGGGAGGGGPEHPDVEGQLEMLTLRVTKTEEDIRRINDKLDRLIEGSADISGKLGAMLTSKDLTDIRTDIGALRQGVGRLEGLVHGLPTWRGMLGAAFIFVTVILALIAAAPQLAELSRDLFKLQP